MKHFPKLLLVLLTVDTQSSSITIIRSHNEARLEYCSLAFALLRNVSRIAVDVHQKRFWSLIQIKLHSQVRFSWSWTCFVTLITSATSKRTIGFTLYACFQSFWGYPVLPAKAYSRVASTFGNVPPEAVWNVKDEDFPSFSIKPGHEE